MTTAERLRGFELFPIGCTPCKCQPRELLASPTPVPPSTFAQYDGPSGTTSKGYNGFMGTAADDGTNKGPSFFLNAYNQADDGYAYSNWWFQFCFCAAAATIVSGAMAERTSLIGYLIYTLVISGWIYPIVVAWSWNGGWASTMQDGHGLKDFAGSGIVHMTGGVAALCGAAIVGPRKGRFDEAKKPIAMPAHNTTFQVLGTMILWVGWYGFNPGSCLAIVGYGQGVARAIVTTTLAAAAGGITVVLTDKIAISHTWDVGMLCNGILAGLVSITAGAADTYPWQAVIIGMIGGWVYLSSSKIVLNVCKVDDPLDAFSVHGACGFWGVIALALFMPESGKLKGGIGGDSCGLFYGEGKILGSALAFLFADIAWTGGWSCLMFLPLKMAGLLRVSSDVEDAGMDVSKHGGSAYSTA
jgi:ammonium transporter, Amt family